MHVSEQAPNRRLGAHSDYVNTIPPQIFETIINFKTHIDLEIEAKMKEQAVLRLYDVYQFNLRPKIKITIKVHQSHMV